MFQNITNDNIETEEESGNIREENKNSKIKSLFSIQNIIIYAVSCMVSMVSINSELAPFGLAVFAAGVASGIPARNSIYCMLNWNVYRLWIGWDSRIFNNFFNIHSSNINIKA